jgi:hypothetical protein
MLENILKHESTYPDGYFMEKKESNYCFAVPMSMIEFVNYCDFGKYISRNECFIILDNGFLKAIWV